MSAPSSAFVVILIACLCVLYMKLRDCDIGATVNCALRQRVRSVSGLTVHRPVTKQDVKLAARLIQMLDTRWQLWREKTEEKKDKEKEVSKSVVVTLVQKHLYMFCE